MLSGFDCVSFDGCFFFFFVVIRLVNHVKLQNAHKQTHTHADICTYPIYKIRICICVCVCICKCYRVNIPRVMLVHGSCGMNRFIVTVFSYSVWIVWDGVLCAEHLRANRCQGLLRYTCAVGAFHVQLLLAHFGPFSVTFHSDSHLLVGRVFLETCQNRFGDSMSPSHTSPKDCWNLPHLAPARQPHQNSDFPL